MKADQKDIKEHSDYLISTRRHKGNAKHKYMEKYHTV